MFHSKRPRTQPCKTPQFTVSEPKRFPFLMPHNSHSFWQVYFRFISLFTTYVSHNQQFITITILFSLNRMGWWWLSRTGFDTASTLLCFVSHLLATHPDVQPRLQEEIDMTLNKDGGHGGLRCGAKNQLLYCAWSTQEAGFADVI
jgi:hypothetical protein